MNHKILQRKQIILHLGEYIFGFREHLDYFPYLIIFRVIFYKKKKNLVYSISVTEK